MGAMLSRQMTFNQSSSKKINDDENELRIKAKYHRHFLHPK